MEALTIEPGALRRAYRDQTMTLSNVVLHRSRMPQLVTAERHKGSHTAEVSTELLFGWDSSPYSV